ncbi:glycoside hydrolase family 16 protein [Fulvivirga sp. M361]|uniref:glycoside hydrolase family 16 protein n=1 Tax=Fulvivirga sp. M361 TaxID=2594266 RepID=UPI00117B5EA5|nr:glycoside hydrolase family 16 protein [Fulvivirga sp. M361]TRX59044.1 glycoside hydrolase family 16 protein [Fulvivirga sp. M361]
MKSWLGDSTLFFGFFCFLACQSDGANRKSLDPPGEIPGHHLIWSDEFDTDGKPDTTRWAYEHGFVRNDELQWYQPENAICEDGVLVIEGRREKLKNEEYDPASDDWRKQREFAEYTSSSINTKGTFFFQYGILEVKAKIDTAKGMWPAIWTLGETKPWPSNGEIDVMEFYRVQSQPSILANAAWGDHWNSTVWDDEQRSLDHFLKQDPNWPHKFHVWKMEWTEEDIRLYLDDELLNEVDLTKTVNSDGFNPFHQPHYILLNLALGSNGGDPSETRFPRRYEVDYVRVYKRHAD